MLLQKQFWGCHPQQVEQMLTEQDKKEAEELNRIISDIHTVQLKNQQHITELNVLLQQFEQYQKQEQEMLTQFWAQVKELERIQIQALQLKNAAQLDFSEKLHELSKAYNMIDNIKSILSSSYHELAHLQEL